jgi:hypothetical protein
VTPSTQRLSAAPRLNDARHIGFGVAGFTACLQTVREQVLPGLFLKPFSQGLLSQVIDGLARRQRLRLQFGQEFVRHANIVLSCHTVPFFLPTVTPVRAGGMPFVGRRLIFHVAPQARRYCA